MSRARFVYDFSSPYAYLSALRLRDVEGVEWTPVVFGAMLAAAGRTPWSFAENRAEDFAEIARRAADRGLPEVRYPEGWPRETWSVLPLRAVLAAGEALVPLSLALYAEHFVRGRALREDAVRDAIRATGLDEDALLAAAAEDDVKARLRANTDAALAAGVEGIPTLLVGEDAFWGDDRLDEALAAAP